MRRFEQLRRLSESVFLTSLLGLAACQANIDGPGADGSGGAADFAVAHAWMLKAADQVKEPLREFLIRHKALPAERIKAVETGGCPHAAIREDISANMFALEQLQDVFHPNLLLLESGGDNLAANFSRELADYTIYVIDVAGGDKVPRKGGPGITQSDLLVINKTDLAQAIGADLAVMDRDARKMRGSGPTVFAQVKHGVGVDEIVGHVVHAWQHATGVKHHH